MISIAIIVAIVIALFALILLMEPQSLDKQDIENRLMKNEFRSTKHKWEKSELKSFYFCYLCHKLINTWFSNVVECKKCGIIVHKLCKFIKIKKPDCKYIVAKSENSTFYHQWRQCNNAASSNCTICMTVCVGIESYICIWCHRIKHGSCSDEHLHCDFGSLRKFVLEPGEIKCSYKFPSNAFTSLKKTMKKKKEKTSESQDPEAAEDICIKVKEGKTPVVVLVNKRSGGRMGDEVIKEFYRALNPLQVISIIDEGLQSTRAFYSELKLFSNIPGLFLVIAGGDGTVCSVLNFVKTIEAWKERNPPAVVLPLGTGNDLSRSLGWGGGADEVNAKFLMERYAKGSLEKLDRWKMAIQKGGEEQEITIYNYIGIGLDGKICKDFHEMREKYPQLFFSQFSNKIIYTQMGTLDYLKGNSRPLAEILTMKIDGNNVNIEEIENIIMLNIKHWGGGVTDLWKKNTDFNLEEQSYSDGKIEVVGLSDVIHMGQVQIGLDEPFQLGQGGVVQIEVLKEGVVLPLQIDGEPLELMSPVKITITRKDQVDMLASRLSTESEIFKLMKQSLNDEIIDENQFNSILELAERNFQSQKRLLIEEPGSN